MGGPHDGGWRLALLAGAWLGGTAVQLQRTDLTAAPAALALAVAAALAAWTLRRQPWLCAPLLALAAFGLTEARAGWRLAEALPPALEGRDLQLTGVVASLPQPGLLGTRFEFELESARDGETEVVLPRRLAMAWFRGAEPGALLAAPPQPLEAGQRWRFTARLRQPHGVQNPGGFDLELWLWERGLRATGSVRDRAGDRPVLLASGQGHAVDRWRQRLREAIEARVEDPGAAGVLAALVVGDQGAIWRATKESEPCRPRPPTREKPGTTTT